MRVDLPVAPVIPARVEAVVSTTLSTELGWQDARVRTVEHLLAALAALGVDDARIEICDQLTVVDNNWGSLSAKALHSKAFSDLIPQK